MTGLENGLGNSKSGSTIMREEGLAPSRRPFETVPIRHVLSSKFNEHAFIYLVLIENDMHNLLHILGLFGQRSFSVKNELKVTAI